MHEIYSSPRRIPPLHKIIKPETVKRTYIKFYNHWLKKRDNDDHYVIDGVDVYSYKASNKLRYFYSVDEYDLLYLSVLGISDNRGFLSDKIKRYYQALVTTDIRLAREHRGFARRVIYEVMFKHYINTLLITDHDQTDRGYGMWENIVLDAFENGNAAVAYINDKVKLVCPLSRSTFLQYKMYEFAAALFGDAGKYSDRGFFVLKKPLLSVLQNTPRIKIVDAAEFLDYGLNN